MGIASSIAEAATAVREVALFALGASPPPITESTLAAPYPLPDDDRDWQVVGSGSKIIGPNRKAISEKSREALRDHARWSVRRTPHGRSVLRSFRKYTLGKAAVHPRFPVATDFGDPTNPSDTDDEKRLLLLNRLFASFGRRNRWLRFSRESLVRYVRDGEVFVRRFIAEDGSGIDVRFIDPELIRDPQTRSEADGIVFDPEDVYVVLEYIKVKATDTSRIDERIPADEISHIKAEVDMNEPRGLTPLTSVLPYIDTYGGWLSDRMMLNRARTNIVLVRKFDAAATDIKAFLDRERATNKSVGQKRGQPLIPSRDQNARAGKWRPGTIINALKGMTYDFISPNLQAADVHHDGRAVLLGISAGTGLAEFMVSADASNSNFASTLVSEGPAVKEIEDYQSVMAELYSELWSWEIEYQMSESSTLTPEERKLLSEYDAFAHGWTFPEIVSRDRLKERQADALMHRENAMSSRTMMERDGISDTSQEVTRLAVEKEAAADFEFENETDDTGTPEPTS